MKILCAKITMGGKNMKKFLTIMASLVMVVVGGLALAACGSKPLYNIDFGGNVEGENYNVAATTWERSDEEGFDAVYTLKGHIAYDQETADKMGYTDGRVHFALIRFTSDTVEKVSYEKEVLGENGEVVTPEKGFYNILNKGTANEKVKHQSFTTDSPASSKTTYYFYQGIDNTVRTLTMHISFDGTKEHEAVYKFVIDPQYYTLDEAV